jgi:hypothetical protein
MKRHLHRERIGYQESSPNSVYIYIYKCCKFLSKQPADAAASYRRRGRYDVAAGAESCCSAQTPPTTTFLLTYTKCAFRDKK